MANVLTINRIDFTGSSIRVRGSVVLSGNYAQYASGAGGEVLNFAAPVFQGGPVGNFANMLPAFKGPTSFDMWGYSGNAYGTGIALGLPTTPLQVPVKIYAAGSSSELAAGAYAAGFTGDNIQFEAVFDSQS
jgi:hypothetical protein